MFRFECGIVLPEHAPFPGSAVSQGCDEIGRELLFQAAELGFGFVSSCGSAHGWLIGSSGIARTPLSNLTGFALAVEKRKANSPSTDFGLPLAVYGRNFHDDSASRTDFTSMGWP